MRNTIYYPASSKKRRMKLVPAKASYLGSMVLHWKHYEHCEPRWCKNKNTKMVMLHVIHEEKNGSIEINVHIYKNMVI